jgi:membrane protease YdiL (CAAX protease family)
MTYNPDDPRPIGTSEPSMNANNETMPSLPPNPYPAPPGWGSTPQPQAPTWPYAPGASPPPGMYQPPTWPVLPSTDAAPALIGPDHVPWKWFDVGLILLIVLVGGAALVGGVTTLALRALHASDLVMNTVVGVAVYVVALLAMWAIIVRKYHVGWSALGVRRPPGLYWALLVPILLGMYVASAIASAIIVTLFYGGKAENPQINDLTGGKGFTWSAFIMALITASVVAPVVEELFFRGVLYGWLRTRWNFIGGVILSAGLFSLAHAIPLIFASIFIVGVTLAIVYEKTKSTLATMSLHSLFNTVGVILVFIDLARK